MKSNPSFFSELEGIRGYAFLVVFFTHYTWPLMLADRPWTLPLRLLTDIAWVAVPVFFVLSGFLITGILLRTRQREGYFRIFYARRAVRVFPLYFLIMLGLLLLGRIIGQDMRSFWPNLVYLQNLLPSAVDNMRPVIVAGVPLEISHFWSLALEEQFYLVWPVVVWCCPNRRLLLQVCAFLMLCASAFRFVCPVLGFTAARAYFSTLTRADAVVLGAMLAVCHETEVWGRLQRLALPVTLLGLGTLLCVAITTGASNPFFTPESMWRVFWMIPVVNLTATAIVLETLRNGGRLQQLCRWRPICRLGSRSYACYAFHLLYCAFFLQVFFPRLQGLVPHRFTLVLTLGSAFALTLALAALSDKYLESPALRFKQRLAYGPLRPTSLTGTTRDVVSAGARKTRTSSAGSYPWPVTFLPVRPEDRQSSHAPVTSSHTKPSNKPGGRSGKGSPATPLWQRGQRRSLMSRPLQP